MRVQSESLRAGPARVALSAGASKGGSPMRRSWPSSSAQSVGDVGGGARVARGLMVGGGAVERPVRRLDVDDAVMVDRRGRLGVDGESADAVSISVDAPQRSYLFDHVRTMTAHAKVDHAVAG